MGLPANGIITSIFICSVKYINVMELLERKEPKTKIAMQEVITPKISAILFLQKRKGGGRAGMMSIVAHSYENCTLLAGDTLFL